MKKTIFIILVFLLPIALFAQDGTLDPTFGNGGIVITDVGTYHHYATSIAVQDDGKIIVAGYPDFFLVRYNIDGSMDNSFGSNGMITDIFAPVFAEAYSLAIQADGKIVIAGLANIIEYKNGFALARLNIDGTLDNSFDTDGKVITTIDINGAGGGTAVGHSVAIQPDGKIIVAGYAWYYSEQVFVLVRYNIDGSLDNSFGLGGRVITDLGSASEAGYSVAVQSDGKIVVGGRNATDDIALVRYNVDGSLDLTFGSIGIVKTDIVGKYYSVYSLVIQSDGKIVVAANNDNGNNIEFLLVRYNIDGSLDNSFDSDGKVTTDFGTADDIATSLSIQSDGKIVVVGENYESVNIRNLAVARYNSNGSLDSSFNSDGKSTYNFGNGTSGKNVTIQSDGKIVIAGDYADGGQIFAVRLNNPSLANTYVDKIDNNIPKEMELNQNYPNPFNPTTTISYSIPVVDANFASTTNTELIIYDVLGKEVTTLVNEQQAAGNYKVKFDASRLSSGIYFYTIRSGKFIETKKMFFLK